MCGPTKHPVGGQKSLLVLSPDVEVFSIVNVISLLSLTCTLEMSSSLTSLPRCLQFGFNSAACVILEGSNQAVPSRMKSTLFSKAIEHFHAQLLPAFLASSFKAHPTSEFSESRSTRSAQIPKLTLGKFLNHSGPDLSDNNKTTA